MIHHAGLSDTSPRRTSTPRLPLCSNSMVAMAFSLLTLDGCCIGSRMQPPHFCSRLKDFVVVSLSFIVCIFTIDYFLFPILPNVQQYARVSPPSPQCIAAPKFQGSPQGFLCSEGQQSAGHEGDSVMYRNAVWKSGIGQWLSKCGATPLISISERFHSNTCSNNCGGRGVCNHDLAECRCFHGYTGKGCEKVEEFPCAIAENIWRVSTCGATCEKSKAFCYCGEGTKYPARPVAEACGFIIHEGVVDWKAPDPAIFSNSSADESASGGWCNVDPADNNWRKKKRCECTYDGTGGALCDGHVQSMCINQCSGNGECRGGFCACAKGWHGIDCSVPSPQSLRLKKYPTWTLPSTINRTVPKSWEQQAVQLNVEKRRPLIYVYDLPPKFNSHLLEGRHFRLWCSTRQYDDENATIWTNNLYGSEPTLLESLLASSHRTMNAEEADYFYVPSFEACARSQADSAPHTDMQKQYLGLRAYFSGALHKQAYEYIRESYPYWNRSGGRDHIWLFAWDEGACSAPKEIWSSIMLVHWGNTNAKHNYSTTAYAADRWTNIPTEWRGNHPCYDPAKDIVLPAWKKPEPEFINQKMWARTRQERPILFYFNGNLGRMYESGRPEQQYSMGLRQKLAEEFGSVPNKKGDLGRQVAPDVIVVSHRSSTYGLELSQSRFCGVFPGDGWSGRLEDSILHGCIPVIVQDGIHLPYENVLDYNAFAVRIAENDLPHMVQILRGINESRVDFMLSTIQGMWQRFTYHNAVKLEAQRQKVWNKREAEWATAYNNLVGDDVFATVVQVLLFKLRNKPELTASTDTNFGENCRDLSCRD